MRILFIGDARSIHTRRWVEEFSRRGHECRLMTDYPSDTPYRGVDPINMGSPDRNKLWHYLRCVTLIKKEIIRWKPDILHAHFISGYGYWADLSGFHPLVLTAWGSDIYKVPEESVLSRQLIRRALSHADLVTGDSRDMNKAIQILQPAVKSPELIFFGVDTDSFIPKPNKEFLKEQFGWKDKYVILSNRRLESLYRVNLILEAFARMNRMDALLVILHTGSQLPQLERRVMALNLSDRVQFVGEVKYSDLPEYLQASDLFVSIPSSDATSVSLLEAMSCGLPVLVSDLPSNREWVTESQQGWIYPGDSVDDLSNMLLNAMDSQDTGGESSRKVITEKACFSSQMDRMETLYKSLL